MGSNTDNRHGPSPDHQNGVFKGYCYSISRGTPASHIHSPHMTEAQTSTVLDAADGTEQVWLDAHPPAVKTWLQARTGAERADFKVNCKEIASLAA